LVGELRLRLRIIAYVVVFSAFLGALYGTLHYFESWGPTTGSNFKIINPIRTETSDIKNKQFLISDANRPTILLAMMPKSASQYIGDVLSESLQYPRLMRKQIAAFKLGSRAGFIIKAHFTPTDYVVENIRNNKYRKIIVHVRDPRQIALSMVHHYAKYSKTPKYAYEYDEDYAKLNFKDRLDLCLENELHAWVEWIKKWQRFKKEEDSKIDGIDILFTSYDELLHNEEEYFNKIVQHFEIPSSEYVYSPINKEKLPHYRQGDSSEWRRVFTAEQKRRAAAIVPRQMLEDFGWKE